MTSWADDVDHVLESIDAAVSDHIDRDREVTPADPDDGADNYASADAMRWAPEPPPRKPGGLVRVSPMEAGPYWVGSAQRLAAGEWQFFAHTPIDWQYALDETVETEERRASSIDCDRPVLPREPIEIEMRLEAIDSAALGQLLGMSDAELAEMRARVARINGIVDQVTEVQTARIEAHIRQVLTAAHQMAYALEPALQRFADAIRRVAEAILRTAEAFNRADLIPEVEPDDLRDRALHQRRHRNTGPDRTWRTQRLR